MGTFPSSVSTIKKKQHGSPGAAPFRSPSQTGWGCPGLPWPNQTGSRKTHSGGGNGGMTHTGGRGGGRQRDHKGRGGTPLAPHEHDSGVRQKLCFSFWNSDMKADSRPVQLDHRPLPPPLSRPLPPLVSISHRGPGRAPRHRLAEASLHPRGPGPGHGAYLLGLLAKIKCSICSYQLNF